MSLSSEQKAQIDAIFSDWIQIIDDQNPFTIESFPYSTGVIAFLTKPHCANCTAINHCCFKNEKGKKPDELNYAGLEIPNKEKGLFHPHCHCKKHAIQTPDPDGIELIIPEGKVDFTIINKKEWIKAMGYDDMNEFIEVLYKATKEAFVKGDYKIIKHSGYGIKINLNVKIPGNGEKAGKDYLITTNYMIFPTLS